MNYRALVTTALACLLAACTSTHRGQPEPFPSSADGAARGGDGVIAQEAPGNPGEPSRPVAVEEGERRRSVDSAPKGAALSPPTSGASDSAGSPYRAERKEAARERPGLGTTWGETRTSSVSSASFEREDARRPDALVRIYYNDERGTRATAGLDSADDLPPNHTPLFRGYVSVEVAGGSGEALPGMRRGDRTYVVGHDGERYSLRIRNNSPERFEIVASVDGLDVVDGRSAALGKRGYLIDAWGSLELEGFRRSQSEVATFRFGRVADSYAARTTGDRQVGVIGVAVFRERGARTDWTDAEIRRRETADPFPGSFARPPSRDE